MDFLKSLPVQYCRICFKDKGQSLTPLNEELKENFYLLTNIHLIKSDIYSNLICSQCSIKILDTKKFRDGLIENELRLMSEISSSPHFTIIDPQLITTQSNVKMEQFSNEILIVDKDFEGDSEKFNKKPSTSKSKSRRREVFKRIEKSEVDGKATCPHCSKSFLKIYIQQHIERVHFRVKNFICDCCGRHFYKHSSIEWHMNKHICVQPFQCPKNCGKKFHSRTSLRTHVRKKHMDVHDYICEICAKDFKEKYLLMEHIAAVHEGYRFKCPFSGCTSDYRTNNGLRKHIESTHEARMEPCEFCGKIFRTGMQIYQHRRLQHSEMKFACIHCDKRFATAALKKNHEKLHNNQKDYQCHICHSRYHIKRNLSRHIQVAHQKSKFFCKVQGCNAVLCNKDNYRTHVRKVHQSMPPKEIEELLAEITVMKPDYLENDNSKE